jgi:predicted Zn-dependent protease
LLNNLAWVLMQDEDPDLERALKVADSALAMAPDRAEIRETRGQILLGLERWKEAVAELELALQELGGRPRLHRGLAEGYRRLGETELAEEHQRESDRETAHARFR